MRTALVSWALLHGGACRHKTLVHVPVQGLSEDVVRAISAKKKEPEWMLEFRLKAFRKWLTMEDPRWSDNQYPDIDYQDLSYYSEPKIKVRARLLVLRSARGAGENRQSYSFGARFRVAFCTTCKVAWHIIRALLHRYKVHCIWNETVSGLQHQPGQLWGMGPVAMLSVLALGSPQHVQRIHFTSICPIMLVIMHAATCWCNHTIHTLFHTT